MIEIKNDNVSGDDNVIKVFISQPMVDKTDEEILATRNKAIDIVKKKFNDSEVEIIDSFFEGVPDVKTKPLYYLSKSLELLATADVAVFCDGWKDYRGCKIEHTCATEYGIETIEL